MKKHEQDTHVSPLILWSWCEQEEQQRPHLQDRGPPQDEQLIEDEGGEMDWPSLLQSLREAVEDAQHAFGRGEVVHGESFTPDRPVSSLHTRLIGAVTWRVRALTGQLKPHGPIIFTQLRPFSPAPLPPQCKATYSSKLWEYPSRAFFDSITILWKERKRAMTTEKQCFRLVREQCTSLTASYRKMQEERLSLLPAMQGEQMVQLASEIAAYDLASCSLQRLLEVLADCYYGQASEEQALRVLLDGLTNEVLFLGSAKGQARGQGPLIAGASPTLKNYHQSQAEALGAILLGVGEMLAPVLTCYISLFVDEAQIQMLDAEPYWSETTRRTFVAETCQKLNKEGTLDESYALLAGSLLEIDYPRDIYSEEDRYHRCALPTLVRRLRVANLIAFIADLRVECADWGPSVIAFAGLGAAQSLLERRAATIPVPTRTLHMQVFRDTLPLLERVGLLAVHPEPCLLCQTHDGHCDMWQVTFPEGTTFGEATQTEYDQLQHSYTFSPTLPGGLLDGWCIFVGYSGIWEPDRPWTLSVLDLSEELAEKREG